MNIKSRIKGTRLDSIEVNVLKGILMCLIILGHNKIFTSITGLFTYLYSFHVVCFFILSVLLNDTKVEINKIIIKFYEYFYPYTVFFIILLLINIFWTYSGFKGVDYSLGDLAFSYISGEISALRPITGFVYIWFMPAIFCCFCLVAVYNSLGCKGKALYCVLLIILSFAIDILPVESKKLFPFALPVVIFILPISLFIKHYALKISDWRYCWVVVLFVVVLLSKNYYYGGINIPSGNLPLSSIGSYLEYLVFITSVFLLLHFFAKKLRNIKPLAFIGTYSLEIYLIHNLINYFIIDVICGNCRDDMLLVQEAGLALVVFAVTLLSSMLLAWICSNNGSLKFLFRYKN
jgi:fucose 4-O-acetylase-like acetyltransferase